MANNILCVSSIISMIVHQCLFWYVPTVPQSWLYQVCLWTSIWNHGTTSSVAQWSDRIMVFFCITHNLYCFTVLSPSWVGLVLTSNGMMCYLISKSYDRPCMRNLYHLLSHGCATFSTVVLAMVSSKQSLT